ncbi:MAG: PilZ domain-containing protein [Desulfobacteraceae bacterium]|nr:PilZ domain-containing protein [Desulfobacteraceae bacterium]
MDENPDRRLSVRYGMNSVSEVNLSVPVMFGFRKKTMKLGLILDISMGGMAIQYDGCDIASLKASHLSIVVPGKGALIEGIPFEIISDGQMGNCSPENSPRRCGLKFGHLTDDQRKRLQFIVNNFSAKKAEKHL